MLDTNAVSAVVKGRASALSEVLKDRQFCISVITEAELSFGLARRAVNADLRRIVESFLRSVAILPWTSACASRYGSLRTELESVGKPVAPMDLLIATHALAEDCTLVSADRAFAQVPGLRVFDWSAGAASDAGAPLAPGNQVQQNPARYDLRRATGRVRTAASRPPTPKAAGKSKSSRQG